MVRPPVPRPLEGRKLLLVDDNEDTLGLLISVLQRSGATTLRARTGKEALAVLENARPDALVTDLWMPLMDGFELLHEARARGLLVPAVALTAFPGAWDKDRAEAAGFRAFFSKPVDVDALVEALQRVTDREATQG